MWRARHCSREPEPRRVLQTMKKIYLLLAAAIIAMSATAEDSISRCRKTYGVAFYNLENLFDTINSNGRWDLEFSPAGKRQWDSEKYALKVNNLANAIANMVTDATPGGPAIVGIAEVENASVVQDLVDAAPLRNRRLKFVHHDSPDLRGIDVGMLYDPEQYEVLSVQNHRLVLTDNPDFLTRDQMCVTGLLDGDSLSVIINHWPSRLGGQEESEPMRIAAAMLTRHIVDSLLALNPRQGIIIMGDLNDDPQNRSVAEVVGARADEEDVKCGAGFYNPWWRILESGKGTLTYRGAWNLFDQILLSGTMLDGGDSGLRYVGAEIMDIEFLKQTEEKYRGMPWRTYAGGRFLGGYSDHFPTQVFLIKR